MKNLKEFSKKINNSCDITLQFVGDSVTYGLNHCRMDETYVAEFAKFISEKFTSHSVLRYDGIPQTEFEPMGYFEGPEIVSKGEGNCKITVIKNGIGGNTVLRAYNRIDDFTGILANGEKPDVTFLMFGINDSLKSDPKKYVTYDVYKNNYKMLVDEIRKRNPDTVIIILAATFNDQLEEIYCKKSEELAREENVTYIDTHKFWLEHFDENADNYGQGDWLVGNGDACHPTPLSAKLTAKYIFDEFIKLI